MPTRNPFPSMVPALLTKVLALGWMARPHFVAGSAIVYFVGALVARSETQMLNWTTLGLGLAVMWLVQIATHLFNEYFDQPTDKLNTHRTLFSGGICGGFLVASRDQVKWKDREW